MLLLGRHVNESVVIQDKDDPQSCCIVRVVDVYPTGDVTLGFLGDDYKIVRNEIFNNRTTNEGSADEEITEMEMHNGTRKHAYYG